uniref:Uncharacterized protein n=1 Tax=Hyaloperonospora arabidopsidis (strain Emoy2) TaxID=559515 RepID=M4BQK3_HYAAE
MMCTDLCSCDTDVRRPHFPDCAFGHQRPSDEDLQRAGPPAPLPWVKSPPYRRTQVKRGEAFLPLRALREAA